MDREIAAERILVIRRDNIGDLVCTTPLIAALRARYPGARLVALTNSTNLPVLEHNPHLDAAYAYTKFKHKAPGQRLLSWLWNDRLRVAAKLRRERFDLVVLASPGFQPAAARFARLTKAKKILGVTPDARPQRGINLVASIPAATRHEVERVYALGEILGIAVEPPGLTLVADQGELARARELLPANDTGPVIAIHLSARGETRQWPAQKFVALVRALQERSACRIALFWSPGGPDHPLYPGDDAKARQVLDALAHDPVVAMPTAGVRELIAGLAACDALICVDGGVMHLAAALQKPMVCLFGDTDPARWHPWGARYELVQAASHDVLDIDVAEVMAAVVKLGAF